MIAAPLGVLQEMESINVGYVELCVLRLAVMHVSDGYSLTNDSRKGESVGTRRSSRRIDLVKAARSMS